MNKTININLGGLVFYIDEDAYQQLKNYLGAIERSLSSSEGKEEIIADIESRIAELFNEKLKDNKQVINQQDITDIIQVMGEPEDYRVDEEVFGEEDKRRSSSTNSRKLYRDTDNKMLAGVSAGLGHYLGINKNWVRLLFLILSGSGGFGLLLYAILWIGMPEAVTTAQKLEMKGEPINLDTIEKKVREGYQSVKKNVGEVDLDQVGHKIKKEGKSLGDALATFITEFFGVITTIVKGFFQILGKLIGLFLIVLGSAMIISLLIVFLFMGMIDIHLAKDWGFLYQGFSDFPDWLVHLMVFIAVGIPFFSLLLVGLQMVFSQMGKLHTGIKIGLFSLWLVSVIGLIGMGVTQVNSDVVGSQHLEEKNIPWNGVSDTITLDFRGNSQFDLLWEDAYWHDQRTLTTGYDQEGNELLVSKKINLSLSLSDTDQINVAVAKKARGLRHKSALDRAKAIDYSWSLAPGSLILSDYFTTETSWKNKGQSIKIGLALPKGTLVKLNERSAQGLEHYWQLTGDRFENNHLWVVEGQDELLCLDCR